MTNRTVDTLNNNFQFLVKYDKEAAEWNLRSLLYFGIVTVRETADFLQEGLELKEALNTYQIIGPDIFTCGPLIESGKPSFLTMSSVVNTAEEARQEVRKQVNSGVDFIKIYATVPPELARVIIDEAHKNDKRVIGHLGKTTWLQAIQFGIDGIVHPGGWFPELDNKDSLIVRLKMMREKGIANDPTLHVFKAFLQQDSIPSSLMDLLPANMQESWVQESGVMRKTLIPNINALELFQKNSDYVKSAYELGVTILAGSDFNNSNTYPGYSLHKELQLLSESGIPNDSLIKIATLKASEWLGVSDKQGTIEIGKRADLIVLNKNPLLDISNTLEIDKVIFKGNQIVRDSLIINH
jgi:imidazolonepropionase-like amidohydrolase